MSKFIIVGNNNESGVSEFIIVDSNNESGVSEFIIVGNNNKSGAIKFIIERMKAGRHIYKAPKLYTRPAHTGTGIIIDN